MHPKCIGSSIQNTGEPNKLITHITYNYHISHLRISEKVKGVLKELRNHIGKLFLCTPQK